MHLDGRTGGQQAARTNINLPTTSIIPYLWGEVDIGSSIEQQLSYVQVFIVCSNVEGGESSLQGHSKECMSLSLPLLFRNTKNTRRLCTARQPHTHVYLAEHIRIGVILQKHCGCACIVVACCNVQRREADLSLGAVVDEQGYDILMSLLKSHGERSESILQRHTGES